MDTSALDRRIDTQWDGDIVPQITEYIRVPAKSPHFDPAWEANGHVERVITQALAWVRAQPVAGLRAEIVRIPKRTPLLFIEVPASGGRGADGGVMLYGHLDKQPEMVGWHAAAGLFAGHLGAALGDHGRGRIHCTVEHHRPDRGREQVGVGRAELGAVGETRVGELRVADRLPDQVQVARGGLGVEELRGVAQFLLAGGGGPAGVALGLRASRRRAHVAVEVDQAVQVAVAGAADGR